MLPPLALACEVYSKNASLGSEGSCCLSWANGSSLAKQSVLFCAKNGAFDRRLSYLTINFLILKLDRREPFSIPDLSAEQNNATINLLIVQIDTHFGHHGMRCGFISVTHQIDVA